jgi:hypothetical protein
MIKFILPAVILFLVVLFWEKISDFIFKKFKVRVNYIFATVISVILLIVLTLLYF